MSAVRVVDVYPPKVCVKRTVPPSVFTHRLGVNFLAISVPPGVPRGETEFCLQKQSRAPRSLLYPPFIIFEVNRGIGRYRYVNTLESKMSVTGYRAGTPPGLISEGATA